MMMPEYLRSELKGMISTILANSPVRRFLGLFRNVCFKALTVAFSDVWLLRMAARGLRSDFRAGVL